MPKKKAAKKTAKPKKKFVPWKPKIHYLKMGASSKRILLRPYKASDFKGWLAGNAALKPKQNEFDIPPPPPEKCSKEIFAKRVKDQHLSAKNHNTFNFGVFDRKTGLWLGGIDLFIISPKIRCANLGYWVLNTHWGNGYAPEAAMLALKIAFEQLDLKRVEASCELKNKASAKVALKAGMFEEGMRRKYPIPTGMKDLYVFGMNSLDWKSHRKALKSSRKARKETSAR